MSTDQLAKFFENNAIFYQKDFSLKEKNTYRTGGNAKIIIFPDTPEKVKLALSEIKSSNVNYAVLGGGSNLLISDDGFDGVVISTEGLKGITVNGKIVTCMAGERVSDFLKTALYNSLGGVEFLSGIPATVGGVVAMNAGCFGKNVGDYVSYVVSTEGIHGYPDCGFGYRTSRFKEKGEIVLSVTFNLENIEYEQSESKTAYFLKLRRNKQPKGRTCGSVFKNDGYYAGKVIEGCQLKGLRIGSARISERHANFIIADQNAKSSDISRLIEFIKKTVKEKTGTVLQEEIEYLGNFNYEDNS